MVLKVYSRKDPYIAHFWHRKFFVKCSHQNAKMHHLWNETRITWDYFHAWSRWKFGQKSRKGNPPFNPTQWAWWLVTVGVREMREVDGFYPHTSPILQLCLTFPPTGWHRLYHLHCYFVWHMAQIWSHVKGRSFICWFIYQSFIMSEMLEISNIKWHFCFWCWVNIIFLEYHN